MDMSQVLRVALLCVVCFGILVFPALGQVQERRDVFICNVVETKVRTAVEVSSVKRRLFADTACTLYLFSGRDWFSIDMEKLMSIEESKKKFAMEFDFLTLNETFPDGVKKLHNENFWSEAKGYFREGDSDQLILLRYKNINITLISSSYDLILKIKPLLREAISENARVSASAR